MSNPISTDLAELVILLEEIYSIPSFDFPSLNKIVTVNTNSLEVVGVQTITGFVDGDVPQSDVEITDLEIVSSRVQTGSNQSGNISDNESLFSVLPNKYISNVDVSKSSLVIRRQFDIDSIHEKIEIE